MHPLATKELLFIVYYSSVSGCVSGIIPGYCRGNNNSGKTQCKNMKVWCVMCESIFVYEVTRGKIGFGDC